MNTTHFAVLLAVLFATDGIAGAQPYSAQWYNQFGTSTGSGYGSGVANDALGNVFITSATETVFVSPGIKPDIWLKKYNSAGAELWSRQVGGSGYDVGNAVAVDALGNAYVSGMTDGNVGGPNAGGSDATLTKFDPAGNALWSKQIGLRGSEVSNSVAIDPLGNVIIGGYAEDDVLEFGAGTRATMVAKFDSGGNLLWSERLGVPNFSDSSAVRTDSLGNVYVAGRGAGGQGGFVKKLDGDGNTLWTKNIKLGQSGGDAAYGLAVDSTGSVYAGGLTDSHAGASVDAFLMKLDGAGNEQWTRVLGDVGPDVITAVAVDATGNPFLTGIISNDPLGGSQSDDVYLAKYNAAGDQLWASTIGTPKEDVARSLSIDGHGNLYIGGYTEGQFDGSPLRGGEAFLIKLAPVPEPSSLVLLAAACCALSTRRRGRRSI